MSCVNAHCNDAKQRELHAEGTWANTELGARSELLEALADGIAGRAEEIAYEDAMATVFEAIRASK